MHVMHLPRYECVLILQNPGRLSLDAIIDEATAALQSAAI